MKTPKMKNKRIKQKKQKKSIVIMKRMNNKPGKTSRRLGLRYKHLKETSRL